jgi:hypothetical protein
LRTDGRRRSAATAIQDWLNAQEGALWGFCCNGERLRLLRDNASLTRPAYIEADLRQIFEAESFADFVVRSLPDWQSGRTALRTVYMPQNG